jgi:hypothetical protein
MQKFRSLLHLSPLHISLTLPQNAFGQIQYFEAPDEELPHYCDLTDEPPTLDEDEELPNYSEIEPTVNLSKIITVKVWGTEITSDSPLCHILSLPPSLPPRISKHLVWRSLCPTSGRFEDAATTEYFITTLSTPRS